MEFTKRLLLTGIEKRMGKNGDYILITVMLDNGKTVDLLWKGENLGTYEKMKAYEFALKINFGKYTNVSVMSIK